MNRAIGFLTQSDYADKPSYMTYNRNILYQWSNGAQTALSGGATAMVFPTYTNNVWDAPASGTNTNNAGATFPNPYTAAQLFTALGCGDKTTCAARMVETPELGWAARARALLWQGYGMP